MKKTMIMALMGMVVCFAPQSANAQFLKSLGKAAEQVGKNMLKSITDTTQTTTTATDANKKISSFSDLKAKKKVEATTTPAAAATATPATPATQPTPAAPATTTTPTDPFANSKVISGHPDFKITIKRCVANDKTVLLELSLLNNTDNDIERAYFYGGNVGTKIYDDLGNIYENVNIEICMSNKSYTSYTEQIKLVSGLPMKMVVMIKNVPLKATSFALVDLSMNIEALNIEQGTVKLRNVPITRE